MFDKRERFSAAYDMYHSDTAIFNPRDRFNLHPTLTKDSLTDNVRKVFKRHIALIFKVFLLLAIVCIVVMSWLSSSFDFKNKLISDFSTQMIFGNLRLDLGLITLLSIVLFITYEMERMMKLNNISEIKLPKKRQNQIPFLMGTLRFSIGNEGLCIDGGTHSYAAKWSAFESLETEIRKIKRPNIRGPRGAYAAEEDISEKEKGEGTQNPKAVRSRMESYEVLKLLLKDGQGGKAITEFIHIPKRGFFSNNRNSTDWVTFKRGVEFGIQNGSLNGFK